jgi:hypothetical protein
MMMRGAGMYHVAKYTAQHPECLEDTIEDMCQLGRYEWTTTA